ncbi:nuclear transport factor 2 family protein [Paraburkholderia sediminicola]|uniref:nuclear transport factor 2 family protein n=1 Tax=Paraburkholderia sediminicola TaxID=458836 RepID=UPI0038BA6447
MSETDLAAIQRLLSDFAWHADRGAGTELSALFSPEGVLWVGGQELRGRTDIAEDCCRRFLDPHRKTRHVWSNLRVETEGEGVASTTAVQVTFEVAGVDQQKQMRVNDLTDRFVRDAKGDWRFASRKIERQMAWVMAS